MPKFTVLKSGVNEDLIASTQKKVEKYIGVLFHDHEIVKIDDFYTFTAGSVTVTVQVLPWHSEDVLVKVYSYVGDEKTPLTPEMREELLRQNATLPLGGFGLTYDGNAIFQYSLAGANLDLNEFEAAVQMVAKTADELDEHVKGVLVA
jgi:hypothetical protein